MIKRVIFGALIFGLIAIIFSNLLFPNVMKSNYHEDTYIDLDIILVSGIKQDKEFVDFFGRELQNIERTQPSIEKIEIRNWFNTIDAVSIRITLNGNLTNEETNFVIKNITSSLQNKNYTLTVQIPMQEHPTNEN
jgi:hypothetical protein